MFSEVKITDIQSTEAASARCKPFQRSIVSELAYPPEIMRLF